MRIVNIEGIDVEACGGTHCDSTSEVDKIVITGASKIQDGVVRVKFKAGEAAYNYLEKRQEIKDELNQIIDAEPELEKIADIYSTTVDQLPQVVGRFVREWKERKQEIEQIEAELDDSEKSEKYQDRPKDPEKLFKTWKQQEKDIKSLKQELSDQLIQQVSDSEENIFQLSSLNDLGISTLIRTAKSAIRNRKDDFIILVGENVAVGVAGEKSQADVRQEMEKIAEKVEGDQDLVKGFKLK